MADDAGVAVIALPDSPALLRDLYISCALCAEHTSRATIMTGVTNPISRDPSVTAAALFTLNEIAPGRIALGIGTGDSAAWGVGRRPAKLQRLRDYIIAVRAMLRGEEVDYEGRTFSAKWAAFDAPVDIPIVIACAGPKIIRLACELADGMLLSMGFSDDNIAYVSSLVEQACDELGRDVEELDRWWNTEIVFGDSVEAARDRHMGVGTEWLTMGSLAGKEIPTHLIDALVRFNDDIHDLSSEYQMDRRETILIERAKQLGLYDWLIARAPGLWGTPDDIVERLRVLDSRGLDKWMFYIGRREQTREEEIRLICEEVLPRVRSASEA
jgi:5,10-methylenetetrahydromethanopterin reductase